MRLDRLPLLASALAALLLPGCGDSDHRHHDAEAADAAGLWKEVRKAVCVLHPTEGNTCHGVVRFTEGPDGVKITATVEGLTPNQKHAIHAHEFGDCSDATKANSAGSHYNPDKHDHGDPTKDDERHAGDFGNLEADASGKAQFELTIHNATLAGPTNPLVGRSVIVHAKPDDFGQPVGNAGDRIACGVIGIEKP